MKLLRVAAVAAVLAGLQAPAEAATTILRPSAQSMPSFDYTGSMISALDMDQIGTGPVTINSITFDRRVLGTLGSGIFNLTFWSNDGLTKVGDFGAFDISVLGGEQVTLAGAAFEYDGSGGPLMMKVELADPNGRGSGGGGLGSGGRGILSAPGLEPAFRGNESSDDAFGNLSAAVLNTFEPAQFSISVSAVPEPSIWAGLILGAGGAGAALRAQRRRRPVGDAATGLT